ncbi:hypothetical protein N2152v2_007961 [Parachlorella kessleri]
MPRPRRGLWLAIATTEPARQGRPRRPAGPGIDPPELLPLVIDPWRRPQREYQQQQHPENGGSRKRQPGIGGRKRRTNSSRGSGLDPGNGGGGRGTAGGGHAGTAGSRHSTAVGHHLQLQRLLSRCQSAAELHGLLLTRLHDVSALDVAFAWHLAASRDFFQGAPAAHEAGEASAAVQLHALLVQLAEERLGSMGPVALSTTAWGCAASQLPCQPLLERIAQQAERQLYRFRPRELCALLWAGALANPGDLRLLKLCSRLLEGGMSLELFSPHDLSVLIWCCGKAQYGTPELLEATTAECLAQVDAFDAPSAARLLHGYAMLQHRPPRLLGPLTRRCVSIMGEFGAHDLSLAVSSLGKLLCDPDLQFLLSAASRAAALVPSARPEHLTNIIWGFARLGHSPASGRFTLKLCAHVGSQLAEYGGELVGAVLWALAKLQYSPSALFLDRVLAYMTAEMTNLSPATLATSMWSFGILAAGSTRVSKEYGVRFRTFAQQALVHLGEPSRVGSLSVHDMPSVLIALATLQVRPADHLAKRLADGCCQVVDALPGEGLSRLAWAVATLQLRDQPQLVQAIVEAPAACKLLPQGIAQLVWSLAALECCPTELLKALSTALVGTPIPLHGLDPIQPADKARIVWAFAQLGLHDRQLMNRLLGTLKARDVGKLGPTGVAAMLWGCAKLQHHPGPVLDLLAKYVGSNLERFSRVQLLQLGWALTRLGYQDAAVLGTIAARVQAGPQQPASPAEPAGLA